MLYSSSQVGMDAGYFTLVYLLFSAIFISNIFRYYFYTSYKIVCEISDAFFCDFYHKSSFSIKFSIKPEKNLPLHIYC